MPESTKAAAHPLSIDELLEKQSKVTLNATVEAVKDAPTMVKVTPYREGIGCLCHLAMTIQKSFIEEALPTGQYHNCCGKRLIVVEIRFKSDASIPVQDVFEQASASLHAHHHRQEDERPSIESAGPYSYQEVYGREDRVITENGPHVHGAEGAAGLVCPAGYYACTGPYGSVCYKPSAGQRCFGGMVCGPGQFACTGGCGRGCYSPAAGQRCFNGLICGAGYYACGCQCYDPAAGQTCH